jgi:hypothetical protein
MYNSRTRQGVVWGKVSKIVGDLFSTSLTTPFPHLVPTTKVGIHGSIYMFLGLLHSINTPNSISNF